MPPRFGLLAALLIAAALSWRRPALRPITVALAALTAANFGHHYAKGALPRTDAAIWGMWPGISAAFAWRAWRGSWWPALPFLAYAVAVPLAPWSWAAHPWAWSVARVVPHWLAPLVALVAWSGRKEDGPEVAALRRLAPSPSTPPARPAFPSAALG